ncbi:3'-5' exonuclease family protein [Geoalkalibacter sp.]|uniref:3'-5' exonuclease family protein n=1 Tax=Geoalkalibacter sp. TaxID=3041440 RepID=UPI00272E733B|nr:3'-5' exonuclease family protein [Geoalkalibacter sp.]
MLPAHCVVLDLETTGTSPTHNRIIEIGLCEILHGQMVEEWSSLVNPQVRISPFITQYTGISDELVAAAPTFEELAEDLHQRLSGKVLIAHNARFDYGFLKNEFARLGLDYQEKTLCTLKLSRRLYPEHRRHGLDALIERHGLSSQARHRALGDVRMTWEFLCKALAENPSEVLEKELRRMLGRPSLPPNVPPEQIEALPNAPGVYLFHGENDSVLYVGKSIDLRARVLSHFSGDHRRHKDMRLSQQIHRLEFFETAGELGALLLEARLVKELSPVHNRRLRRTRELHTLRLASDPSQGAVEILSLTHVAPKDLAHIHGLFRSPREAQKALREIASEHNLCLKVMGLEKGRGACFAYQLKKCRGACLGQEPPAPHRVRLQMALSALKLRAWPFAGTVGFREKSPTGCSAVHVFDQWCHLGTAQDETALADILERHNESLGFDLDGYKILCRYLEQKQGKLDVVFLAGKTAANSIPVLGNEPASENRIRSCCGWNGFF